MPDTKQSICLNMIVKDESHVIEKTLQNLCDNIPFSYWVISDTGSSDNTIELIENFFKNKNIPGEIVQHKWKDFSHNRNKALECAFNKTDYAFIFDADDHIYGNFTLPEKLIDGAYNLKFGKQGCVYERTLLINNRIPWEYVGVLHEVIVCKEEGHKISLLDGDYYIESGRLGSRNNDPNKYKKDAKILQDAFYEADKNNEDIRIRYSFYCAQSYKDCGQDDKAIEWYKRRAEYGGWDQEVYFSYYMVGDAYNRLGEKEKAIYYWVKAHAQDPQRIESMYHVIHHYYEQQDWKLAYKYFKMSEPYLNDDVQLHCKLFVWKEVFTYHYDFDVIIITYHNQAWQEGIDAFQRLWKLEERVDDGIIGNIIFNFQFFLPHLTHDISEKGKVFVSCDFFSDFIKFINRHTITNNYKLQEIDQNIIENFIDLMKPAISNYNQEKINKLVMSTINPKNTKLSKNIKQPNTTVFLSFTTCKRLDLFEKTVNSLLLYCEDIETVDYFFCVDDNSSFQDREKMRTMFPFMNFYFKTTKEKGHRPSMNIIWNKIKELQPMYWIHMEDDWLFLKKDMYITRSISYLNSDLCISNGIKQVLFNKNYGETMRSLDLVGGQKCKDSHNRELLIHIKDEQGLTGSNCAYWPHYSFRPSVTLVPTIMELGDFTTENSFFERDYANKFYEKGYKSMFFNEISCLHIGKLTSETNEDKKNAYALNNVKQGLNRDMKDVNESNQTKGELENVTNKKAPKHPRIAFHCTQLCERGDAVALYDYAYYNRELLNNESVIFYKDNKINKESVILKCKREFICVSYNTIEDLEELVQQFGVDYMYNITWGNPTNDYNLISCPILWHGIFTNTPFSRTNKPEGYDKYAVISRYLTDKYSCAKKYVPHMINMPHCNENDNYRNKYGIPQDAFVLGRYGGTDSFDIGYVHQAIREILNENNKIYFIFANTDMFFTHERIIYVDTLIEQMDKARFIQTCDMMIHGRTVGETFGISLGEFSFYNKPVMTNLSVPVGNLLSDNCHVEILGDKGFIYKSCEEVKAIINKLYKEGIDTTKDWKAYNDYTPEKVMQRFHNMYLNPDYKEEIAKKSRTKIVNLARRPDRKKNQDAMLKENKMEFLDYEFFTAVDGLALNPTKELKELFIGNDFGSRRGMIGCALSHYNIWNELSNDTTNDYYIVLEDDFTALPNFHNKMKKIITNFEQNINKIDVLFLGYSMFQKRRDELYNIYNRNQDNITITQLEHDNYIGGTFGYIVSKEGANKFLDNISRKGIKQGIDIVMKKSEGVRHYECQPHIVFSDWNEENKQIDTDIQNSYDSLDFQLVKGETKDEYKLFEGFDLLGGDILSTSVDDIEKTKAESELHKTCVGFNTFGYLKSNYVKLERSPFVKSPNGIYLNLTRLRKQLKLTDKTKTRVKLMCNWTTSAQLCREWQHMLPNNKENVNYDRLVYNDFVFTSCDIDIDFYVIINKPRDDEYYEPNRTIVFHMEPWCGEEYQTWGVKTWGEWANPDPTKFLQVRNHENFINNAFWQLSASYDELKNKTPRKTMDTTLSTICSSKYVDPGQKKRIDFIKFIEDKIDIDVYNQDNQFNFKNWKGCLTPHKDKDKGIMPYKYYFMVENNCEHNFITEKIWEPLLAETLCFYDGCPNITDHIDSRAFVQINMDDFEGSLEIIRTAIREDWWSQRIDFIRQEKQRVLDYFGFFPTVERVLKQDFKMKIHPTDDDITYAKYFNYKPEISTTSTKTPKEDTIFDVIKNVNQSIQCENGTDKNTTHSYLHIYEKYLASYRKKENTMLEIGVMGGHSIVLWNYYLPRTKIIGMDINYSYLAVNFDNNENVKLLTMDGTDPETPKTLNTYFDIILDDASHFQHHQIQTLDIFLPYVKEGGIYIIEDIDPANDQEGRLRAIATKHNYTMTWHDLRDLTPVRRFDNIMAVFIKS